MRWMSFPDAVTREMCATVDGLPWFAENSPRVWRLPGRLQTVVRPPVWHLATEPSGGRIRFRTNATALAIRVTYTEGASYGNMPVIGQMGFDLYIDGRYARSAAPGNIASAVAGDLETTFAADLERRWRDVAIYLPMYCAADVVALGTDDDAEFAAPTPFAAAKPVVFYGSSITQGGCASRPGMTYQAILGRRHNLDFVNLGFSGNGLGEPEVAAALAEIDAACYVLDYCQNLKDPEAVRAVYAPFMEIIRKTRPETQIVCVTPIYAAAGIANPAMPRSFARMSDYIRAAVADRILRGDRNVRVVEGHALLGPDLSDGFVDGLHPNDVGFQAMAERLGPILANIVGVLD